MKKQRFQYWILAADIAWVLVSLPSAYALRYGIHWYHPANISLPTLLVSLIASIILWAIIYSSMQLDGFRRGWHPSSLVSQLFVALSFLMIVLLAGGYLLQVAVSRLAISYFALLLFFGFLAIRCSVYTALGSKHFSKAVRRVLIVGNGPVAREMASKIQRHPEMLCKVVGFLYPADTSFDPRLPGLTEQARNVQALGLIGLLLENGVDDVIVTSPGIPEVMNLAAQCRHEGFGVSVVPQPYQLYLSRPQLFDVGGLPVLQLADPKPSPSREVFKRGFDLVVGFCFAVLSSPIVAIGAIALVRPNRRPLITELRCGQHGGHFRMYRLNLDRDSRDLSPFERFLVQLSITELPQVWNVLLGNMSLVGPRPESPERVKHYSDWQRQRLNVKPGITGLAQVNGLREQHSSEEKSRFDLQYMMDASLFLDISLILQTAWTLIGRLLHIHRLSPPPIEQTEEFPSIERILFSVNSTQSSAD